MDESKLSRYGLTELAWSELTMEQRELHYNRHRSAEAPEYDGTAVPDGLREAYSFDPYSHTPMMIPHVAEGECPCQMCVRKIGRERLK